MDARVYKMDEHNWVATKWSLKRTVKWYKNELGLSDEDFTKVDIEKIEEYNLDTEGMWGEASKEDINKTGNQDELCSDPNEPTFGDIKYGGVSGILKFIPLRQALQYNRDFFEPYIIASTEW